MEDDDSDGAMSVDSNAFFPPTSCVPTVSNKSLGSTDNLKGLFLFLEEYRRHFPGFFLNR
jgi:hypothetical protein